MQNPPLKPAPFALTSIGYVETECPDHEIAANRRTLVSDIVIFPEYLDALTGIDDYSHLIVLFFMERGHQHPALLARPRGNPELPMTGVLAMRGRAHPNPIGLAVVDLLARAANRLKVRRLDAHSGTPIIDIKPYDHYDSYSDIRVPEWLQRRQNHRPGSRQ